ncbi:hypothetical protein AAMO2058_000487400 [Amorphochlora amoebiformis]
MASVDGPTYLAKVVLIGDSGVGKTSLIARYVDDVFSTSFVSTIGVDFKSKNVHVGDNNLKLMIWDTAGQERFRTITSSYYRGARGIMVVFDVTDVASFERVTKWVEEASKYVDGAEIAVVGNKCDLPNRKVSAKDGWEVAKRANGIYFETSANKGTNVEEAFEGVLKAILKSSRPLEMDESTIRIKPKKNDTCRCSSGRSSCAC